MRWLKRSYIDDDSLIHGYYTWDTTVQAFKAYVHDQCIGSYHWPIMAEEAIQRKLNTSRPSHLKVVR